MAKKKAFPRFRIPGAAVLLLVLVILTGCNRFSEKVPAGDDSPSKSEGPAAVVGNHSLSAEELSYFYIDRIRSSCTQWQSALGTDDAAHLLPIYGLDVSVPLDEQFYDPAGQVTWASYFAGEAISDAASCYGLWDAAKQEAFVLPEETQTQLQLSLDSVHSLARSLGFETPGQYLRSIYGRKADMESYEAYLTLRITAEAYAACKQAGFTYDDAALRAYEADIYHHFSSFSYYQIYIPIDHYDPSDFKDTEKYLSAAKDAASAIARSKADTLEEFNAAIAKEDASLGACEVADRVFYEDLPDSLKDWLCYEGRESGHMTLYADYAPGTDNNVPKGYCVVMFRERQENTMHLVDLCHIPAATLEEAQDLLERYRAGAHTLQAFSQLSTASTLCEKVYPGQLLQPVDAWCFDSSRQAGDVEIIPSTQGYHIVYFSGTCPETYRDFRITQVLRARDYTLWLDTILSGTPVVRTDIRQLELNYVIEP